MRFFSWLVSGRFGFLSSGNGRKGRQQRRKRTFVPLCESLEDRMVPSTLVVTNTSDNGSTVGSLRYEIAHSHSGDIIRFASSLSGQTISLTGGELAINHNLRIAGLGEGKLT